MGEDGKAVTASLYTQVHCVRSGEVLLMKRNKEPNLGLWVAPGGRVEADEAPYDCAARELLEETGLQAHVLHLRGIASVVMPELTSPHLQFLFVVPEYSGQMVADEREGSLRWWPIDEIQHLAMPDFNRGWLGRILDMGAPFYQAKYVYDAHWQLVETVEFGAEVRIAAPQR